MIEEGGVIDLPLPQWPGHRSGGLNNPIHLIQQIPFRNDQTNSVDILDNVV
jgi:hypothetical protein